MEHAAKVESFLAEMKARGVDASTAAPPAFRKWWASGREIPPPHFLEFWPFVRLSGFYWGSRMFVVFVIPSVVLALVFGTPGDALWFVALNAVLWALGGLLFGVIVALAYQGSRLKLGLPAWQDYPAPAGRGSGDACGR